MGLATTQPHVGWCADPLGLRHEHKVLAAVLQTLDRVQPNAVWSMVDPREQENLLPHTIEYFVNNFKLLP